MKKKKSRLFLKVFAAVLVLAGIGSTVWSSFAMPDETNAVHIEASEIEDATLIIGSHLIYLGSMNDQIYEIATESASETNQYNKYYKSELAGGAWYDITEAGSLEDITTAGKSVLDSEIEALWMTHHTKSDGITYDLFKGVPVSIFNIKDPYSLEGLTELEPIKMQYDTLVQTEDPSDTIKRDILYIEELYKKDRHTEETGRLDKSIDYLQKYYEILVRDGADSAMSDKVLSVMEKIDAARRALVFEPLNEHELQTMNKVVGREFIYIEGEVTGEFVMSEDRNQRAEAAAEAAASQATAAAEAVLRIKETELNALNAEADKKAAEAIAAVEALYGGSADIEQKKKEAEERVRAEFSSLIESKTKEIEEERKSIKDTAQQAAEAAKEVVMSEKRDTLENFVPNNDLITAIGEAMSNVQESYITYSSNMLEEGSTILSSAEYELSNELISNASDEIYSECDECVMKLIYLDRINESVISEEDAERTFIASDLIRRAEMEYTASLSEGEGEAYRSLSSVAAAATKTNVLKQQKNETEIVRNELQFIIQAYTDRMSEEDAANHILGRIDNIDSYRSDIKNDAYADYASSSVDAHLQWLTQTYTALKNEAGNSQMDNLTDSKKDLQAEMMAALDENNLRLAKKIETQITAVDKEIEDLENKLNAILNSDNTSASEKANAASQLGSGSATAAIQDMKNNILEDLINGDLDGVENALDGIGTLAAVKPDSAIGALKEIYQELSKQELAGGDSKTLRSLMEKVEQVTADNMSNFTNNLSESDLAQLIAAYIDENIGNLEDGSGGDLGDGLEEGIGAEDGALALGLSDVMNGLSDEAMSAVLAALSMYAEETGDSSAKDALSDYGRIALGNENPYVFEQNSSDRSYEYAPTDKISIISKHRYIFNDSQKAVTMQKGSKYYKFVAFSAVAENGTVLEDMEKAAAFHGVIYIPKESVKKYFGLEIENLFGTNYGTMLSEDMKAFSTELLNYLLEAGGEA